MPEHTSSRSIREFIVTHVAEHPQDISHLTASHFQITRQAVGRHIRALVADNVLTAKGETRGRTYELVENLRFEKTYPLTPGFEEDVSWTEDVKPQLNGLPRNVLDICGYGFTEILNNAIDHSESKLVTVVVTRNAALVTIRIDDQGIGIFRKIREKLGLKDDLGAIVELAKGKLTTDPRRHSGEGIFFTSRLFDSFSILSGSLFFSHSVPDDDWLIEDRTSEQEPGTLVKMKIGNNTERTLKEVFDRYASEENDYSFSKTHIPVKLMQYGNENLISRSQAKRLLARSERFEQVLLDFSGVESIGQGFADEVFRVFQNEHPNTKLIHFRANENVEKMILRAKAHDAPK